MITELLLGPVWNLIEKYFGWRGHRREAAIQIVGDLRQWMSRCNEMVGDIDTWQGSDGRGGSQHYELPDFSFETSKEVVAKLNKKAAVSILELIQNKNDANASIRAAIEYWADDDDTANLTRGKLAQIFLQADPIHRGLAKIIGWGLPPSYEEQVARMQREVARAKKAEEDEAKSTASLFDEISTFPG